MLKIWAVISLFAAFGIGATLVSGAIPAAEMTDCIPCI